MNIDCDSVIAREIDIVNSLKDIEVNERRRRGEADYLPNCDLSIWMRSCEQEVRDPLPGESKGEVPLWLKGALLRNGPGSFYVGNDKFEHIFDGSSLLHRFAFKDGKATYQCRFLQSDTYKRNHAAQRIVVAEFGTGASPDPCHTIFQKLSAYFTPNDLSDNCMISIYPFGDELYTFSECPTIHRVDPVTLETLKKVDVSNYVNIVHHSSHPHVEEDGTVFNIGLTVTPTGLKYSVVTFPKTKKGVKRPGEDIFTDADIVATIPVRWTMHPSYMHTFGMTESYFIIVEQPMSVSATGVISLKFSDKPMASNLKWFEQYNTLIHLVSRNSGSVVASFWAEPFFYLHIINQYEDSDYVVIDICVYKNPSMIDCMYIEALKAAKRNPDYSNMFRGRPMRFVLPLSTYGQPGENLIKLSGSQARAWCVDDGRVCVSPERLCDLGCETPRINYPTYLGKKYKYFYAISSDVDLDNPGTLIKVDTVTRSKKTWSEKGAFPSEPIFVPRPYGEEEDDGVVLSALLWSGGNQDRKVAVIILDAKSFTEIGRSVFETPTPVPKCLHGWFTNVY